VKDIAELLEDEGSVLSLRAARYIRIKWQTEEGLREQLHHCNQRLDAAHQSAHSASAQASSAGEKP